MANQYPIDRGKVQRPLLRDETLSRERLLEWLAAKIHHRVVLVVAEAGYGKTTLLADFARHTRLQTLWYRLDEEDRSWVGFLNYLVAAGREIDPLFAPNTGSLLREMETRPPTLEGTLDAFVRELRGLTERPTVLILDDVHLVDDVADVRLIIRALIQRAPDRLTIVLSSRRQPAVPLSRLRAQGEVAELSTSDLRFSRDETERLFRETYARPLEPDVLVELDQRTEGWAASLQLVQFAVRDRGTADTRRFVQALSGARGELYDFLAEEVISRFGTDIQNYLMRTSLLPVVTLNLAAVATGFNQERIREITQSGEVQGVLSKGSPGEEGHSYHPLVRDFLEARLRQQIGLAGVASLHRTLAAYSEDRSWRQAAHHYAAAGDSGDVHRVLVASTPRIMGNGEFALAERFIERFPPSQPMPWFEIVLSRRELHRGRLDAARTRARRAFELFDPDDHGPDANLALANLMSVLYAVGELGEATVTAHRILKRTTDPTMVGIATTTDAVVQGSLEGDLEATALTLERMIDLQRESGFRHYLGIALLDLACTNRARGYATRVLEDATEAFEDLSATSAGPEVGAALTARAWALAHLGRRGEASSDIDQALALPFDLTRVEIMCEAADVHGAYYDPIAAQTLLDEAEVILRTNGVPGGDYWDVSALLNLARLGRWSEALLLVQSIDTASASTDTAHRTRLLSAIAIVSALTQAPSASREIDAALASATRQKANYWRSIMSIYRASVIGPKALADVAGALARSEPVYLTIAAEAVAAHLGELPQHVLDAVQEQVMSRHERWRIPLRHALQLTSLSTRSVAGQWLDVIGTAEDVGPLRRLSRELKGRRRDPQLGRRLARRLAQRVFVEDQGRVTILIGTHDVPGSEIRRKVLSLLCYLLSRSDSSATRDQVLEALWPDTDPEVAANSLNQTIYFLRRVFEPAYQEELSAGYVHYESDLLWLDRELVSSRSRVCGNILRALATDFDLDLVRSLIETYRGRFALDFSYEEWAAAYRDSMHARYLEMVERSVAVETGDGNFDKAIAIAHHAVEIDSEAEQLQVSLVRLYRRTGSLAAAAERYGHYAAALRHELGVEPPRLDEL